MGATPLHLFAGQGRSAALDDAIRAAIGYRVVGPEGALGTLVGVPEAGRPLRPSVIVVRDQEAMRFVALQRVAAASPSARLLLLGPEPQMGPSPDGGIGSLRRRSTSSGLVSERSRP